MNFSNIGSEWKRWDLHFHTPSSYDYGDKSVTNQDIVDILVKNKISAVAITDHHIIDIDRIKDLQKLSEPHSITILPGIEFLSDARGKDPIHFIAIFPELSNINYIWAQIENVTAIKEIKGKGKNFNEVYCDLPETIALVKKLGGIVSIHAGEKSGSLENITHSLPHGAAQKTDIASIIDIYELGKVSDADGYRKFVFPAIGKTIPMIICSDNHNIKKYVIKEKLWIKGKPNFSGLKYALNEPDDRFFIGDEPIALKRLRENPTKFINSLSIFTSGNEDPKNIWFKEIDLPLNSELITIIGNKGSGKSAISDVIALCADAEHSDDYLFLHKTKFKKKGLADRFSAVLSFGSGKTAARTLDFNLDPTEQSKVRYLPQTYFEKVCNEIGKISAFREEIEKVVFQYIKIEQRLDKKTFDELITYKKSSVVEQISHIVKQIEEKNTRIILLEDKISPEYRNNLISKQRIKQAELDAHVLSTPAPMEDPRLHLTDPTTLDTQAKLSMWQERRSTLEESIGAIEKNIISQSIRIADLERLSQDVANKFSEITIFKESRKSLSLLLGIDIDEIFPAAINLTYLEKEKTKLEENNAILRADLLDLPLPENVPYDELSSSRLKLQRTILEIGAINEKLNGKEKEFQNYLESQRLWEAKHREIIGDENTPESIAFFIHEIDYIDTKIAKELEQERNSRIELSLQIYLKKKEIKNFYDEIKIEIEKKLVSSKVSGLTIASTLAKSDGFEDEFLKFILQNKSGSFYSSEGKNLLQNDLIAPINWNEAADIKTFLTNVMYYLEEDKRPGSRPNTITTIGNIVKNRSEFYKHLFSLGYIQSHYDLQQNGKNLDQLSPGEKGALLLIFYLVLDKEDIPLIIDQPEDNLDNYSVAKILVPYIKEAKKKRQIILVTHNPNLAVVSDSEQVIKVEIDKENGNIFSFKAGGIEDDYINDLVVEVLEGTVPAFLSRKGKYRTME